MNKHLFEKLTSFLRFLKFVPGMKQLLLPTYNKIGKYLTNRSFKRKGLLTLEEFDKLMTNNNINYSIFAGTLLGAIREKGPLKHDLDLDTIIFDKDYSPRIEQILLSNGFKIVRRYLVDEGRLAREETYGKHGVTIDIYYAYSDDKYPTYMCDFIGSNNCDNSISMKLYGYVSVRRLELPISYNMKRVQFGNIQVNAIDNAEEWLSLRYGKDYMIPNPNYHDKGDNPNIYEWKEVKGTLITYDY